MNEEAAQDMEKVLIVDDDDDLRAIVRDVLKDEGFSPLEAADGLSALKVFRDTPADAVLLDLEMPGMGGMETLQELRKLDPQVPVIILTAFGDIPTAVRAIQEGAYDFSLKPPEFERLIITLRRAVEKRRLETEVTTTRSALQSSLERTFGKSGEMKAVISQIRQIAATNFSIVIQGETGTGKSFIAGAIHEMSKRADKAFVNVDIGLIPDSLVESELFGYRKGAFTGADRDKAGYFASADGGTIFIDELENMSPQVQSKLLSVIERKKIFPLGCTTAVDVDTRIISATNVDIRDSMLKKRFREDLFYRLSEFILTIPPLRERKEDIRFFSAKFLVEACAELNKQIRGIADDAFDLLTAYSWPGNIRELKNVIRRAVLLNATDIIDRQAISALMRGAESSGQAVPFLSLRDSVRETEKIKIREALDTTRGNKTKAAELLEISYRTLFEKLKEYGLG
jgi:DNA-binding NtrC family response regulator